MQNYGVDLSNLTFLDETLRERLRIGMDDELQRTIGVQRLARHVREICFGSIGEVQLIGHIVIRGESFLRA